MSWLGVKFSDEARAVGAPFDLRDSGVGLDAGRDCAAGFSRVAVATA